MKTLRRYIFLEILSPFFIGLLVFSFVLITRGSGKPLELLVQKNVTLEEVGQIFLYITPGILTFSIPMAVLLGILVCFGRLSADSEITAMRSGGIGVKNLLVPVIAFSTLAWLIALMNSNFWEPRANYRFKLMKNEIFLKSISTEVRPRVFEEGFYPLILFIQDISTENPPWKGIFLADVSDKNQPKITIARSGNLINDPYQRKLQLHLSDGAQHSVVNKTPESYQLITFQQSDIPTASISGPPENTQIKKLSDMSFFDLMRELHSNRAGQASLVKEDREKLVEISRRFALPFSVFIFSILGVPLGVISRRGGKSYGFIISLVIFLVYYLLLFQGINFAKSGRISAILGPWLANIVFLCLGIYLLLKADRQIEWDRYVQQLSYDISQGVLTRLRHGEKYMTVNGLVARLESKQRKIRTALPLILDKYVIIGFFRYFFLVLSAFILIFIIFTFFELLNDIVENRIPAGIIVNYFRYLLPQIIYYMIPFSVLVGVLVNFSILTRTSQIVAMKSSGISLYRLSASVLVVATAISVFSFALQEYVMPFSNQKQDALRATIKGKSPQTYYRPDRKWMMGEHSRIFNYNYFDEDRNLFGEVSIYEIDPVRYEMKRRIFANRAFWDSRSKAWIFEDGWSYGFESAHRAPHQFQKFSRARFPEISEEPQYFKKEVKESSQMNYHELEDYIDDLSRSGFDVVKLTVALHKKFSFPLISVIMCMIAIPFSFSTGKRGSLYGIGLSIMIGVIYWIILGFFEQVGSAGKLLPLLAAWAPNLVFGASGIYLLFRIET